MIKRGNFWKSIQGSKNTGACIFTPREFPKKENRKFSKGILILSLILISLTFVSAGIEIGNESHSVLTTYVKGSYLSGWINISFNETSLDSLFEDSLDNSVSLENLLKTPKNENFNYDCSTQNCSSSYEASLPQPLKLFTLENQENKLIGFKFTDKIEKIDSISFNLVSDALASCSNQIKIDILDDETTEIFNNKSSNELCPEKNYGCFEEGYDPGPPAPGGMTGGVIYDLTEILISENLICQRINFSEGSGFKIGAWVKEKTAGNRQLIMEIYNLNGNKLKQCNLSKGALITGGPGIEISCDANYSTIEPTENYVCIHTEGTSGEFKTRGYNPEEGACGFVGHPPKEETSAYQIFVQKKKFGAVGEIEITNNLQNSENFAEIVEEYIIEKYGSLDCSEEDCLVPIRINSFHNQQITIKDLVIYYDKVGLPGIEENNFYDFTEISSKISSDFQKLYLDGKFLLPDHKENLDYKIYINEQVILDEEIEIKDISMTLSPMTVGAEILTEFEIEFSPEQDIESYEWDFGDGIIETTSTGIAMHKYTEINNYSIKVFATENESGDLFFKVFKINVVSPEEEINETLKKLREDLENIKSQIEDLTDEFTKKSLKETINIENLENKLNELEINYTNADTEEEFLEIARELSDVEIPSNLLFSSTNELTFFFDQGNINLEILSEITEETYNSEKTEEYVNAILLWNQLNFETKISTEHISINYHSGKTEKLKIFKLEFDKEASSEEPYLIVGDLDNILFDKEVQEKGNYKYLKINQNINEIKISTIEDISFENFPAFIAPEISALNVIDNQYEPPTTKNKKYWIWILIGILIIVAIIMYILLHRWYKNKYEKKLFPNTNNLYNLSHYINNAKRKGTPHSEIRKNLKKANWTGEQITYAMKKYAGKNTGMFSFKTKKKIQ